MNAEQFAQLPPELQQLLMNANTPHASPQHTGGHAAQHTRPQVAAAPISERQKMAMMALHYSVQAIDVATVVLKWTWLPFVVYVGSSKNFGGQSVDWLAYFRGPPQQQMQQY